MYTIKYFIAWFVRSIVLWSQNTLAANKVKKAAHIHKTVVLGGGTSIVGELENIYIGPMTYLNGVQLEVGKHSKIIIGSGCAFGYRVSIKARTHSIFKPTSNQSGDIQYKEADIRIGNDVWVGDGVYIREGVVIGNNVIVGANSVVTKNFPDNVIIAGVPAVVIKKLSSLVEA